MSSKVVVIPTFNEKENIEQMVRKVFSLDGEFHLLIVDDGSPDGTGAIVKKLQQEFADRLLLIERQGKQGLGTAYIRGFNWAIEKQYDFIFEMDCDFSHNPDDLLRLYAACSEDGADLAVGSRYTKGGGVKNWPFDRIFISRFASFYVQMITWLGVKDSTAGFVCFRRQVLETIDLNKIRFIGYAFQIEMKFATKKLGFKIQEVPIIFTDRVLGVSKMSSSIIKEAVFGVLRMQIDSLLGRYNYRK